MNRKIVLVTGVSSGLGKAFAKQLLDNGYTVIGTVRSTEKAKEFELVSLGNAIARIMDVADYHAIAETVEEAEKQVGPIYALINNAGYGHEGTLEESPMEELHRQFAVNVFGPVALMKTVLPFMRQRREGRILNITSMGGLITLPGISFYHGSKFALEGISASLGKEVKDFGIFVTAIEPGMFRTDWAGRSMVRSGRSIPDYDSVFDPIRSARASRSGRQPGDPVKAARAVHHLLEIRNPPTHLLLGPDALEYVSQGLASLQAEIREWEPITKSTNFDE